MNWGLGRRRRRRRARARDIQLMSLRIITIKMQCKMCNADCERERERLQCSGVVECVCALLSSAGSGSGWDPMKPVGVLGLLTHLSPLDPTAVCAPAPISTHQGIVTHPFSRVPFLVCCNFNFHVYPSKKTTSFSPPTSLPIHQIMYRENKIDGEMSNLDHRQGLLCQVLDLFLQYVYYGSICEITFCKGE